MSQKNQTGAIPLVVLAIVFFAVTALAVFVYSNKNNLQKAENSSIVVTPIPAVTPSQSATPSSTLKTLSVVKPSVTASSNPTSSKPSESVKPKTITLRGYGFEDRNNNGVFDADDVKVGIRDFYWYDTVDPSLKLNFQTDSSGNFDITYTVKGNLGIGGVANIDLNPITPPKVFSGNTDNIVFAFRSPDAADQVGSGIIEGDVFQDSNRNGKRDGGENSIYFYKLYLIDSNGGYHGIEATDESGHFKYEKLPLGTYTLQMSNPTGTYIMDQPTTTITLTADKPTVTNVEIPVFKQ